MANTQLNTRIILCNDTTLAWSTSTKVLLKGEVGIELTTTGESKIKVGDGVKTFAELPYSTLTPTEISALIESAVEAGEYDDTALMELIQANTDAIAAINNADTGILAQAKEYADGKDEAIAEAKKAGTDAQTDVDALETLVGTIPEGYTSTTIAEYAKELADKVAANGYDDTEIRELIQANADAIDAHKEAIDETVTTLVGEDTGKSVRTIANEELAKQLIPENAAESLDTLEEIAAWIQSHPDDASAMNKAIEDLEALVGTLPEGITATTVVGYIDEAVAAAKEYADGLADDYATAEQGAKADTAIQKIKVEGVEVAAVDNVDDITSISTDALTQGTNTFILNGGGAN